MLIQKDISLLPYNTFQIDAKAKFFVEVKTEEDVNSLVSNKVFLENPRLILGGGANVLFTKDYKGLVIKVGLLGKEIIKNEGATVLIKVGAGEDWHETMMWILEQGYVGGENLVYIPGTVGSAPVGNIGAYGKEAKDIIYAVEGIDLQAGKKQVLSNADCHFDYRDSVFKHERKDRFLVTSVIFEMQKDSLEYQPNVEYKDIQAELATRGLEKVSGLELANIILELRKNKLPDRHEIGTAGSFFKNPIIEKTAYENLLQKYPDLIGRPIEPNSSLVKLSAGQLIELVGLKGHRQGYVGTSEKHALVLINYGGGKGADIVRLAKAIQKKVLEKFAIALEPEVLYV